MAKKKALTEKQKVFSEEYIQDLSATKAAKRAGYSKASATNQGHRLINEPHVRSEIQKKMDERSRRLEISADNVLREIAKVAFIDIRELFAENGDIKPPSEWTDEVAAGIAGLEIEALFDGFGQERQQVGFTKKVKMNDKLKALELLGRHLVLFKDKVEIGGLDGLASMIAEARKRVGSNE